MNINLIRVLKCAHYEIDRISNKNSNVTSDNNITLENYYKESLGTKFIGQHFNYYDILSSTNETAKSIANNSADGTIVLAKEQSGGKGRLGRVWSSHKGGIWLSIVLKPNILPIYASKVTQIAAASYILVLRGLGFDALIKWPNDIYINNKKVCGVLTEMKCDKDRINYLVVGSGLNVNLSKNDFPKELLSTATSLQIEGNKKYNKIEILCSFLKEFERLYIDSIENNNSKEILSICRKYSIILDKKAFLITSKTKEEVTCIGINDDGLLIVKDSNGNEKKVISGEITFKNI